MDLWPVPPQLKQQIGFASDLVRVRTRVRVRVRVQALGLKPTPTPYRNLNPNPDHPTLSLINLLAPILTVSEKEALATRSRPKKPGSLLARVRVRVRVKS